MTFKKQLLSVVAASAVLLQVAAPIALASTTITISGNGEQSNNTTNVATTNTTTVQQSNTAEVTNTVKANAESGDNSASGNTGGNVLVNSGASTVDTHVTNALNSNAAQVNCNCGTGNTDVTVKNNGEKSDNSVGLAQTNANNLVQQNAAEVSNNITAKADSGDNSAVSNTGGNTQVIAGAATVTADVVTTANANVAQIGGLGAGSHNMVSALISGNGENSDNDVNLALTNANNIWQANEASVENNVTAKAESGDNSASGNTGGHVLVGSHDASAEANVDNMVNFNSANLNCGCVTDLAAEVSGNGENSSNDLGAALTGTNGVYQGGEENGNSALLDNYVAPKADSGDNSAISNTNGGTLGGDPSVISGASDSSSSVSNSGNVNVFGTPLELPGNFDFNFSFDFNSLFGHMGL